MKSKYQKVFKHFLCFDQICFDGIEYGLSDLYYCVGDSCLYIKMVDRYLRKESESKYPILPGKSSREAVLEGYLIDLLSYRHNFAGTPVYVSSDVFTEAEFEAMLNEGIARMDERDRLTRQSGSDNELIRYCESAKLSPEPDGGVPQNWSANCPSGGQHHIMISTKSNQWGCGYCRRKGGLPELKLFVNKL
jgi:hypothetical protein